MGQDLFSKPPELRYRHPKSKAGVKSQTRLLKPCKSPEALVSDHGDADVASAGQTNQMRDEALGRATTLAFGIAQAFKRLFGTHSLGLQW